MNKGMPGCGSFTIKVWSGGCMVYSGNVRKYVGALSDWNDEEEKKTTKIGARS